MSRCLRRSPNARIQDSNYREMNVYYNMAEESAVPITQIQLDNGQDLLDKLEGKGKNRQGAFSDSQIALQLYKDDLERTTSIVSDRKTTNSIARAC